MSEWVPGGWFFERAWVHERVHAIKLAMAGTYIRVGGADFLHCLVTDSI